MSAKSAIRIWLTSAEREAVVDAAADAHMEPDDYCRLMVLAAAGMGGAIEHLNRAADASICADSAKLREINDGLAADVDRLRADYKREVGDARQARECAEAERDRYRELYLQAIGAKEPTP